MFTREYLTTIYQEAVWVLQDLGYRSELYENYSGRGMYGRETIGIVTEASGPMVGAVVSQAILEADEEIDFRAIPQSRDSMGLDTIYYYGRGF